MFFIVLYINFFTNFKHFLVYIFYVNWDWGKMPFFNRVIQVKCHFSNRGFQVKCHLPTEKWGQNIQVDNGKSYRCCGNVVAVARVAQSTARRDQKLEGASSNLKAYRKKDFLKI